MAFVVILISSSIAICEENNQPKTKLEEFSGKTGVVIVKGYTSFKPLTGVTVYSQEFINVNSGKKEKGISIEVEDYRERTDRSFVDHDEIDSLIAGIDYIAKIEKNITKLNNFEASYSTKGGLEITTFNSNDGSIKVAISCGRYGRVSTFHKLAQLNDFKMAIIKAKENL